MGLGVVGSLGGVGGLWVFGWSWESFSLWVGLGVFESLDGIGVF